MPTILSICMGREPLLERRQRESAFPAVVVTSGELRIRAATSAAASWQGQSPHLPDRLSGERPQFCEQVVVLPRHHIIDHTVDDLMNTCCTLSGRDPLGHQKRKSGRSTAV